jgi:hypothetical protein
MECRLFGTRPKGRVLLFVCGSAWMDVTRMCVCVCVCDFIVCNKSG